MNIAAKISDRDALLDVSIYRTSTYTQLTIYSVDGPKYVPLTQSLKYFLGLPGYNKVELRFPKQGTWVSYFYETRCMLHLLEYIFRKLPFDFTEEEFKKAAHSAVYHYEYDGSFYLLEEDLQALQEELNTCSICGAKGPTNAHNTCSGCESELDQLLEGM